MQQEYISQPDSLFCHPLTRINSTVWAPRMTSLETAKYKQKERPKNNQPAKVCVCVCVHDLKQNQFSDESSQNTADFFCFHGLMTSLWVCDLIYVYLVQAELDSVSRNE